MHLRGGGKGKWNDKVPTILKYVTSVKVEDIMKCIEAVE
jgi:hypothetical protein